MHVQRVAHPLGPTSLSCNPTKVPLDKSEGGLLGVTVENRRLHSLTPDRAAVPSMSVMAILRHLGGGSCRIALFL